MVDWLVTMMEGLMVVSKATLTAICLEVKMELN